MPPRGRFSTRNTYRRAQLAARQEAGRLSDAAVSRIRKTIAEEADRLAAGVAALPIGTKGRDLGDRAAALTRRLADRVGKTSARAIGEARGGSFTAIAAAWQDAALEIAAARDVPGRLLGALATPPVTLLGAYEALGGAGRTWRQSLGLATANAGADLDAIVRRAIAAQVSPEVLAARLKEYVRGGAPAAAFAGPEFAEVRRMLVGQADNVKGAAARLSYNAKRIAFSEIHNARAEAEVMHMALDPFVGAVRWELSPFRGAQVEPDECDFYAGADLYGLGPGIFPVDAVPFPPHPFDRCERFPVPRPIDEAGTPKRTGLAPARSFTGADVPRWALDRLTAARAERIVARANEALRVSERAGAAGPVSALIDDGLAAIPGFGDAVKAHRAALAAQRAPEPDVVLPPPPAPPPVDVVAIADDLEAVYTTEYLGVVYRVPRRTWAAGLKDTDVQQWIVDANDGNMVAAYRLEALEKLEALGMVAPALRADVLKAVAFEALEATRTEEFTRRFGQWAGFFKRNMGTITYMDETEWSAFLRRMERLDTIDLADPVGGLREVAAEWDHIAGWVDDMRPLNNVTTALFEAGMDRVEARLRAGGDDVLALLEDTKSMGEIMDAFTRKPGYIGGAARPGWAGTAEAYPGATRLARIRADLERIASASAADTVDAGLNALAQDFANLETAPEVRRAAEELREKLPQLARDELAADLAFKGASQRVGQLYEAYRDAPMADGARTRETLWKQYDAAVKVRNAAKDALEKARRARVAMENAKQAGEVRAMRRMLLERFGNAPGEMNRLSTNMLGPKRGDLRDIMDDVLPFLDRLVAPSVHTPGMGNAATVHPRLIARGSYHPYTRLVKVSDRGRGKEGMAEVFIHEVGHHLEHQIRGTVRRSKAWIQSRAGGEKPAALSKHRPGYGYRRDERAVADQFIDPYIGKEYADSTEVISMGLEYLWANPKTFLEKDRDHFRYVITVMRGL